MAGKKGSDNSKKAAGQARKAEAAANKAATENAKKAAVEEAEWQKGSKNTSKKEVEAAKKAEQAQRKAERDALLAEEESNLPGRAAPKNKKTAVKKINRGLDSGLAQLSLGGGDNKENTEISASGVDAAIDAFVVMGHSKVKVDAHPERRYGAAYAAYEERRMIEMAHDGTGRGLRLNQRKKQIKDEFAKSPENPFNQVTVKHNATAEEKEEARELEKTKREGFLTSNQGNN